ncbi:DoxX-like family protein [Pseudonocardia thermophila]|jgi:hypothetical protein|uniref:DoxX-like family protein n=1 Tax=Pseudonocardia thermophila TaxID=1848 RepID=A0A1M6W0V4_PSETH|nr:DoxX family protein [Pseudonocardia thermophila]SHK87256.1 DoxX-like family protein [Pseudonocardia thermophila]
MAVFSWILQGILALAFLAVGAMKLVQDRKKLIDSGLGWAEDFSDGAVKGIGALEVLGAIGLVLPTLTGIAPVLTPLAALGLTLIMIGAGVVHVRRNEGKAVVPPIVLGVLALVVAILRFGPLA